MWFTFNFTDEWKEISDFCSCWPKSLKRCLHPVRRKIEKNQSSKVVYTEKYAIILSRTAVECLYDVVYSGRTDREIYYFGKCLEIWQALGNLEHTWKFGTFSFLWWIVICWTEDMYDSEDCLSKHLFESPAALYHTWQIFSHSVEHKISKRCGLWELKVC